MRIGNATYEGTPSTRPEEGMVSDQDGRSRIYISCYIQTSFTSHCLHFQSSCSFSPTNLFLHCHDGTHAPSSISRTCSNPHQPLPILVTLCSPIGTFQYCQLPHKQHLASLDVEGCLLVALRIPSFHIERDRRRLLPLWTNTSTLDRHLHISGPDKQQTVGGHRRQLLDRLATT